MEIIPTGARGRTLLLRLLILIVALLIFYLLFYWVLPAIKRGAGIVFSLFAPFLLAAALAALIEPLVNFFERRGLGRAWAVSLAMLLGVGVGVGLLVLLVFRLVIELVSISTTLPVHATQASITLWELLLRLQDYFVTIELPREAMLDLQVLFNNLAQLATRVATSILNSLLGIVTFLPAGLLMVLVTLLATFFFSRDKKYIKEGLYRWFSHAVAAKLHYLGNELGNAIVGFVRAQLVLMLVTVFVTLVGLYYLQVSFAVTMAILVGVADLLPVIGPGSVLIPWAVWAAATGDTRFAIELVVLFVLVTVIRQVIQPKVLSDSIGVHPLEVLVVLYVGLKAFGVMGALLAPIALVLGKAAWRVAVGEKGNKIPPA